MDNPLKVWGVSGKKLYQIRYRIYTQISSGEGNKEVGAPAPPPPVLKIVDNFPQSGLGKEQSQPLSLAPAV